MADDDGQRDPGADPGDDGLDQAKGRNLVAPTPEEYARWLKGYLGGAKSPARLAKLVRASIHRVRHAVRTGWPERSLPALADRAQHAEEAVAQAVGKATTEAQVHAAEVVATIMAGTWEDAAKAQLAAAASTTQALTSLAQRLSQAAAQASFSTFRRVPDVGPGGKARRDEKGNVITVLKEHVSAFGVANAAARLTAAAKDHATLSKALMASIAPGQPQGVLVGPPAVVLYLPDNGTSPPRPPVVPAPPDPDAG